MIRRTANPARLDYSEAMLGSMVLASDEDAAADQTIQQIITGAVEGGGHARIDDVHHLSSHRMQGNDIFVTWDKDIVRPSVRERLKAELGIVVLEPREAVAAARGAERPASEEEA